jgi:hypothetical protein
MGIHGLIHLPTTSLFGKSTISKKMNINWLESPCRRILTG